MAAYITYLYGSTGGTSEKGTISIKGKNLEVMKYKVDTRQGGQNIKTKVWFNKEIPGGLVKTYSKTDGYATVDSNMELVDFKMIKSFGDSNWMEPLLKLQKQFYPHIDLGLPLPANRIPQ